jgi:hypothetical protein
MTLVIIGKTDIYTVSGKESIDREERGEEGASIVSIAVAQCQLLEVF